MKKSNLSDPYEDFVRIEKLDAYEAQIKSNQIKSNSIKNPLNNISYYYYLLIV